MKSNRLLILAVLFLLGASCTREIIEPQEGLKGSGFAVGVSLTDASVKTFLGQKEGSAYKTLWSEGDKISLNGRISQGLTSDEAGSNSANFIFGGGPAEEYNFLYPATYQTDVVTFPAVQKYYEGSFDPLATPMYGSCRSSEDVTLRHLSSLLKFTLTSAEPVTLSHIHLKSIGAEPLSGTFNVLYDEDGLFDGRIQPQDGNSSVSVSLDNQGCVLGSEPSSFYVSIPHGTYSEGFTVMFITDDNQVMTRSFYSKGGEHVVSPSKVIEFESLEFVSEGEGLFIKNEADLQNISSYPEGTELMLIADLDFSGKKWVPITDFAAVLDGAGHLIRNLPAPLCRELRGTVKNLTIEAAMNIGDANKAAAFAELMNDENALIENCVAKGKIKVSNPSASGKVSIAGLVVEIRNGTILGCSNHAEVKSSSRLNGATSLSAGGCLAMLSGGKVSALTNYGHVLVDGGAALSSGLYVGGVMAEASAGVLEGVVNAGWVDVRKHSTLNNGNRIGGVIGKSKLTLLDGTMISNTPESSVCLKVTDGAVTPAVGGLVGMSETAETTLTSLVNKGAVRVEFSAGTSVKDNLKVGGVVGYFYSGSATELICSGCVNEGNLTVKGKLVSAAKMANGVQIGGVFGRCQITGNTDDIKAVVSDCRNAGNITLEASEGSSYAFVGGVGGVHSVKKTELTGCSNTGDITMNGTSGGAVFLGGITGSVYRDAVSETTYSGCRNEGNIALYETGKSDKEVAAGGIVGNASGIKDKAMTLHITDCVNSGNIDRLSTAYNAACNSYAGGIVGVLGRRHMTTVEGYVNATISRCSNSGQIIFNQYAGREKFIEPNTNISFTGGILGAGMAQYGYAKILCCSNSGNLLSTSGQHGGIVGFASWGTFISGENLGGGSIEYTVNTGNVCEYDPAQENPAGSGYCIAGGILGYLRDRTVASEENKVEYCRNSGNVAGSVNQGTEPCAGGIVGKCLENGYVRYCKNSGSIRNYFKSDTPTYFCGSISGSQADYAVEYCGVGGRVERETGWVVLSDGGALPFQDYIYRGDTLLDEDNYKGCCFWDGTSVLPWEKADWVEAGQEKEESI